MDKVRLVKLLGMTTSEHDGEALNAMRMANDLIKAAGKTWEEVLTAGNVVNITLQRRQPAAEAYEAPAEDWSPPHLTDKVLIDAMFRAIYAQPRSDNEEFWQWVDSVHQQWLDRKRLTPGQYQAVRRCYSRAMQRA